MPTYLNDEEITILETNGNLILVEYEDGRQDWLCPFEVNNNEMRSIECL